jgi:hypothetical protein
VSPVAAKLIPGSDFIFSFTILQWGRQAMDAPVEWSFGDGCQLPIEQPNKCSRGPMNAMIDPVISEDIDASKGSIV